MKNSSVEKLRILSSALSLTSAIFFVSFFLLSSILGGLGHPSESHYLEAQLYSQRTMITFLVCLLIIFLISIFSVFWMSKKNFAGFILILIDLFCVIGLIFDYIWRVNSIDALSLSIFFITFIVFYLLSAILIVAVLLKIKAGSDNYLISESAHLQSESIKKSSSNYLCLVFTLSLTKFSIYYIVPFFIIMAVSEIFEIEILQYIFILVLTIASIGLILALFISSLHGKRWASYSILILGIFELGGLLFITVPNFHPMYVFSSGLPLEAIGLAVLIFIDIVIIVFLCLHLFKKKFSTKPQQTI